MFTQEQRVNVRSDLLEYAAKDQRVRIDARVVTTAGAKVTIHYDRGCDVRLEENQRFTVSNRCGCCALVAAVVPVGAPLVSSAITEGITAGEILGAAGVACNVFCDPGPGGTNVSPN